MCLAFAKVFDELLPFFGVINFDCTHSMLPCILVSSHVEMGSAIFLKSMKPALGAPANSQHKLQTESPLHFAPDSFQADT